MPMRISITGRITFLRARSGCGGVVAPAAVELSVIAGVPPVVEVSVMVVEVEGMPVIVESEGGAPVLDTPLVAVPPVRTTFVVGSVVTGSVARGCDGRALVFVVPDVVTRERAGVAPAGGPASTLGDRPAREDDGETAAIRVPLRPELLRVGEAVVVFFAAERVVVP